MAPKRDSLAAEAECQDQEVAVHLKVDTGMRRIGIAPEEIGRFLERCRALPRVRVRR